MTAELLSLVDAQSAARQTITSRTVEGVSRLTYSVESWGDPEQIRTFTASVGAIVGAGQRAVAGLTEIYLARVATALGTPTEPDPIAATMGATRRTLQPGQGWDEVYGRVATTYRVELAATGNRDEAFHLANTRAREMVVTDLGLAYRDQADVFIRRVGRKERSYLFAYRRVIRPELSNGHVCGLCIAASTRLYYRGDLMPLHARCHCEVMLVTRDSDPGGIINDDELGALYDQAGSTSYVDLRRTKYTVEYHGELGPQLRYEGHSFKGPDTPS